MLWRSRTSLLHYSPIMLAPGVRTSLKTLTPDQTDTLSLRGDKMQSYKPACTQKHTVLWHENAPMLTFDPVSLIEADFSLSLGRVWSSGHKDSSWDGAVEASPLACSLCSCAGRRRPGRERAESGTTDLKLQFEAQSSPQVWVTKLVNAILWSVFCFKEKGKVSTGNLTLKWKLNFLKLC